MPFSVQSDDFAVYDVTCVENLFIQEYMPQAPGEFVRVYLYGLMLCRHPSPDDTLQKFSASLGIPEERVLEALRYWERLGLVEGISDKPPAFRYLSVRSAMLAACAKDDAAYAYGAFNNALQANFEALLHPREFSQAMEWVEDLGIPEDVALYMVKSNVELMTLQNGGKARTPAYAFKALNKIALRWASEHITTMEAAEREMSRTLPGYRAARATVALLGQRRNPTAAEVALADKWLGEWGYTEDDIRSALTETTRVSNPSFSYIDGILARHKGAAGALDAALTREGDVREAVKRVLAELGAGSRAPTDEIVASYEAYLCKGFVPETILRAAALNNKKNRHAFRDLEDTLEKWLALGLTTSEAADDYIRQRAALRALTLVIFNKAGIGRVPTEADLDQTLSWRKQSSEELILCAAEKAKGLQIPEKSIAKRLGEWAKAGVVTRAEAEAFKRPKQGGTAAPAPNPALSYPQRDYQKGYFDDFFEDLSTPTGGVDA